ncbi:YkvS family protein [Virgibacillus sediminis]|uniref:YkvS family protein n=1 Tax=Virgibacillus sediminis TaxID=202260 RepID=A0ABV7AAG9_9BACI
MFHPDEKKAKPGDVIEFERNNMVYTGKVMPSRAENSIVVDISEMDRYEELNHGYHNTVVNHTKYRIVEEIS